MELWKKLLEDSLRLRELLDIYLELRLHFKEMGFSESDLDDPPTYTITMMNLHDKFQNKMNALLRLVKDYGFDISRGELITYIEPLLTNINKVTPLENGNNKRDNSGDEDNQ